MELIVHDLRARGTVKPRTQFAMTKRRRVTGSVNINILIPFIFGVAFLFTMLVFGVLFPNPTPFQLRVFTATLALSAAGVGAMLPGAFHIQYRSFVRAGGALGLFAAVYWFEPTLEDVAVNLVRPEEPPEPVAEAYLAAVDAGDIRGAWQQLDPAARRIVAPDFEAMQQVYEAARARLGRTVDRDLVGTGGKESPSGLPTGLYQELRYETKFSKAAGCRIETIILRATQDMNWRVFEHVISPLATEC